MTRGLIGFRLSCNHARNRVGFAHPRGRRKSPAGQRSPRPFCFADIFVRSDTQRVPSRLRAICPWLLALATSAVTLAAPLRVGVEADLEPISFVDAHGTPKGFAVDLLSGIARESHLEFAYVVLPRDAMLADFA